jgi:hypothetical protein
VPTYSIFKLFDGLFDANNATKAPFTLSNGWRARLTQDLDHSRKWIDKQDFDGSFRTPKSKYTTRAVDWIALVCYAVPSLIVPTIQDDEAVAALMAIVRFVQRT